MRKEQYARTVSVGHPIIPHWKLWLVRIFGKRIIGHDENDEVLIFYRWRGRLYLAPTPIGMQSQPPCEANPTDSQRCRERGALDTLQLPT
jgi:hypothetical protein